MFYLSFDYAGNYISGFTFIAPQIWKTRGKLSHSLAGIGIGGALKRKGLPELQEAPFGAARTVSNQLVVSGRCNGIKNCPFQ